MSIDATGQWFRMVTTIAFWAIVTGCSADVAGGAPFSLQQAGTLSADDNWISISTANDVVTRRDQLTKYVWGPAAVWPPSATATAVPTSAYCPSSGLENLSSVVELNTTVTVDSTTVRSIACHFKPQLKNDRAAILHLGHSYLFSDDSGYNDFFAGYHRMINSLLRDGFSVVVMYMPLCETTSANYCTPASSLTAFHTSLFDNHASGDGKEFRFFLEPVAAVVNYLKNQSPSFQDYSMVGLSGGGWTTVLYAALDPSIKFGFDMSGSMPLYRRLGTSSWGDKEQNLEDLYYRNPTLPGNTYGASYKDLYIMASHGSGRRFVQVLRRLDNCCFGAFNTIGGNFHEVVREYELAVRARLYAIGAGFGSFRTEIDETETIPSHMMSWNGVLNQVMSELNQGRRYVGAATSNNAFVRGVNGHMWRRSVTGWSDTGLEIVGTPAVVEGVGHQFDVYFRDFNNTLRWAHSNGAGWTQSPVALLATAMTDPSVAVASPYVWHITTTDKSYVLHVFNCTTAGCSDNTIGEQALGPAPIIADWPNIHVFYRGRWDRSIHRSYYGSNWYAETVGGTIVDFPAAVKDGSTLRVFVRGQSPTLWQFAKTGGASWVATNLSSVTGSTSTGSLGTPSVVLVGGGDVRVYSRTLAGALGSYSLSAGSWTFSNLGGGITGSPSATSTGAFCRGGAMNLWLRDTSGWHGFGGVFD